MEINRLVLIPCIPQYVEEMHLNLDKASRMCPISFVHEHNFPYMKPLC
jgi:hypothetical protein